MDKKTLHITGVSNNLATNVMARHHEMVVDEPEDFGGKDSGANPLEYVLTALAGCVNVMIHVVAKELNFEFEKTEFDIEGTFDARGLQGVEGVRPYFKEINLVVKIKTDEDQDTLEELRKIIDQRCPVFTMLDAADIKMNTEWKKV